MKANDLTIRLDKDLDDLLTRASRRTGRNRSEIA
ncbi:MAG TPA: ribbon-helix-helix protein, CopG family, partial [Phycisphaerales bacterium]|nr:ribbon-helix-helix protein, CopG family [Phycisphaerales bacterium]